MGLPERAGRTDLRGLVAPQPGRQSVTAAKFIFTLLKGAQEIRGVTWRHLDLGGADLRHLRFVDCRLEDCVFDDSDCRDWRLWDTRVARCSFRRADLRGSALGAVEGKKRNAWEDVDFTEADLRETYYGSGDIVRCRYKDAKLTKVDFEGMVFKDCTFEGELEEVTFNRYDFGGEAFPPNLMDGVDFRRARFHWVTFRGLDLENLQFPEDDEHIIIDDYRTSLERILAALQGRRDDVSRQLAAVLGDRRKRAGPSQRRGIIGKGDLRVMGGEAAVTYFSELLRAARNP